MVAAAPILDEVADELADTRYAVMLADRGQRLADVRCAGGQFRHEVEKSGGVEGITFNEDVTGTNSIATAFELRHAVVVRGEEHYVESLRRFSCYGLPVFNPVTRRVEGVLDISCLREDDTPLIAPFVTRLARQISERLLVQSRPAQAQILQCFQVATAQSRRSPVVAVGSDIFLANSAALQVMDAADEAVFRAAATTRAHAKHLWLTSGRRVMVASRIVPHADAAVFIFDVDADADQGVAAAGGRPRSRTLVSGEPGTGRTAAARSLVGDAAHWLDTADIGSSEEIWLSRVRDALADPQAVVLEHIDLLGPALVHRVSDLLRSSPAPVVMTTSSSADTASRTAELTAYCDNEVTLQPLRHRRAEIPHLVTGILSEIGAERELRFTPGALGALAAHDWPGNLHELRAAVQRVVDTRRIGDVIVADLPQTLRNRPRRALRPIEQAERDTIITALQASRGNKKLAAQTLGISRTTLYRALRTYQIVDVT
jgi:transcriptional regulator of acetoin/glycerol metabolism